MAVASASQPPALGIAEFAPAARQELAAPPSTANAEARGANGSRPRSRSTTTTSVATTSASTEDSRAAPTTLAARSRQCVGNPPRQIEDPQSPPCLATIFEGDNRGATSTGVTGTEIRVAIDSALTSTAANAALTQMLVDFFNHSFELYGRRIVVEPVSYNTGDPVGQRATADDIASRSVFAAFDKQISLRQPAAWLHQTLARHRVISLVGREVPYSDALLYDFAHPFVWSINPSIEQMWRSVAELACVALAGRPAAHAGEALAAKTRKFGVLVETFDGPTIPMNFLPGTLKKLLEQCDTEPVVIEVPDVPTSGQMAAEALESAGVTTILCACASGPHSLATVAKAAGYEPEILLPSMVISAETIENSMRTSAASTHTRHVFGVYPTAKMLPYQVRPFYNAMRLMNPTFDLSTAGTGGFRNLEATYRQLLILASGIQGAGPNLTPETFAQALTTMQFPNPGAGQAPYWQPAAGFGPGDHSFFDDVALAWWNPDLTATGVVATGTGRGSWCFLGGGTRFAPGAIPADADSRFFRPTEPCR